MTQLFNCKLEVHGSVSAYYDAINSLVDSLATCGKKVDKDDIWFYVTNGLPASWSVFRQVIEGNSERDVSTLLTKMLGEEARLKRKKGITADSALYAKRAPSGSGKRDGRQDHTSSLECFYCNRTGHKRWDCPKFKADKATGNLKTRGGGNSGGRQGSGNLGGQSSAAKATEDVMWVAREVCVAAPVPNSEVESAWIIDSSCSCHLTGSRELFVPGSYVGYGPGEHQIRVADNGIRGAAGYGDVIVNVRNPEDGRVRAVTVRSVLHVPGCGDNNLLSMGQLEDLGIGFEIGVRKGVYQLVRKGVVIAEMDKVGGIYILRTGRVEEAAMGVAGGGKQGETGNAALWHFRLGHLGLDAVERLGRAGCGVPPIVRSAGKCVCEACLSGKMACKPFKSVGEESRAVGLLNIVHSDLMGPMEVPSISGSRFVLLFIDDRSWYKHCYILSKKSEAFDRFKEYKALVEQETGRRIGKLRTDGGGEYTSMEFLAYLHKEGIVKETTTPHTPQSNGVSERTNRTIMETAKAMMFAAGAPKEYWAEAVSTAVYLRNIAPTCSISEGSPYEAWYGRRHNLTHLRV